MLVGPVDGRELARPLVSNFGSDNKLAVFVRLSFG